MTNSEISKAFAAGKTYFHTYYNNLLILSDGESRTLYSYGTHFPIAKIDNAGNCFFTTRGYSNSTSKHIRLADSALAGYLKIYCPVPGNSRESFKYWQNDLQALERELITARDKARRGAAIMRIVNQIKIYCRAAGVARPGWLSKFVHIANTLEPTKAVKGAYKKQMSRKNWAVYSCDNGEIISKHYTDKQARKAIDKYNQQSGTFGYLNYDLKYIY